MIVFPEGLENISEITEFLADNTFNTCAETEVQMKMKFFKDKSVTIIYKTDWWDDEKNGADPNARETLTGFKNPASAKMFTGITELTVLSLVENAGNFKNKKEIIDLLRQNGAK